MNRLEISDLSYCQAVTNDNADINGGHSAVGCLELSPVRAFPPIPTEYLKYYSDIYRLGATELDSGSTSIDELENPITGESGYRMVSADGNSTSIVLSGPSSRTSFSIAVS